MKKHLKMLTATLALALLLTGIVTSASSFTTTSMEDTGTEGAGGTGSGTLDHRVLVSGIDCSYSETIYDTETGKILLYIRYKANKTSCLPGNVTCDLTKEVPCLVYDIKWEIPTNQ